jgi:streptomycin 6-kinase
MTIVISEAFAQTQRELHGARGEQWLAQLPQIVAGLEQRWGFRALEPFPSLSYNYVAPVRLESGEPAVLKLAVPNPEFGSEVYALEHYRGDGVVRLITSDRDGGAMLLERVLPGRMLAELEDDDAATRILATLMRRLWQPLPPDHPLPTVAQWCHGLGRLRETFGGGTGPFPEPIVQQAERTFADLLASAGPPVLVHGDLHHLNVLSAEREPWLVIDPKGLAGDPGFDVGAMLHNPSRTLRTVPDLGRLYERRLAIMSEILGIARERLAAWAFGQALLSSWWTYEDHGHVGQEALQHAEIFRALMGS